MHNVKPLRIIVMRRYLAFLSALIAAPALASTPPPPPSYVWDASEILITSRGMSDATVSRLFSDQVVVRENGETVATGKTSWLKWRSTNMSSDNSRLIGYSESSAGYKGGFGEVLIVDTFDTVNRSKLPSSFVVDPRMATRTTLYRFGADHLIHAVDVSIVGGFWMTTRP